MKPFLFSLTILACACALSCSGPASTDKGAKVEKRSFGQTTDGQPVDLYALTNANGMRVEILTYGATVRSIEAPDRTGKMADVVLGFDTIEGYLNKDEPYLGAVVGRYGNRIAKARFKLDGKEYHLAANNGPNSLHGGIKGFDKRVWTAKDSGSGDDSHVTLSYLSKDGEEGYPGNLEVTVTYTLTKANELKIDYSATTDQTTVLNVTNHSYFNLTGGNSDILDHELALNSTKITPVDATLIPTGEIKHSEGTPFDFRNPTPIGARINQDDEQLKRGKGYDHNFVVSGSGMRGVGEVYEPKSGRFMQVYSDQPGVQFYTGNFLDGSIKGKGGKPYGFRSGLCLETQHYPDSPNQPSFPSTVLKPGDKYASTTTFKFTTKQ